VYSLSSSLLLRRITISNTQTIVDLKLSKSNPDLVFVVVSDGTISLWNWSEGDKLASVNYGCKVFAFDVAAVEEFAADTLFLIVKSREGQVSQSHIASVMFAHRQTANSQASLDQLSATYNELSHIQVLDQGRVIFAASETTLVIGWSPRRRGKEFKDQEEILKHQWKVVGFPEGLSCFDARYFPNTTQSKDIETKTASTKPNSFSIAIGSKQGIIYVYSDILDIFRDDKKSLKPRKLHWHRHPVGSLKWSLDGKSLWLTRSRISMLISYRKLCDIWWTRNGS
jgi:NET1-associated nuclear protein 1 (U3 small nucleolar RNA-associated protein 17)